MSSGANSAPKMHLAYRTIQGMGACDPHHMASGLAVIGLLLDAFLEMSDRQWVYVADSGEACSIGMDAGQATRLTQRHLEDLGNGEAPNREPGAFGKW